MYIMSLGHQPNAITRQFLFEFDKFSLCRERVLFLEKQGESAFSYNKMRLGSL